MKPQFQPVPLRTSLYDFCQGVIAGKYDVAEGVKAKVDSGEFRDVVDWAEQLLQEFNAGSNEGLSSQDVCRGASKKKVWWQKICGGVNHRWLATPDSRTTGYGCTVCAGQSVHVGVNDFATVNPSLADEWHPVKNGKLTPQDFTYGSTKKVWWLKVCNGVAHEWEAEISTRNKGSGCSICHGASVQAGVNDLATISPSIAAEWHPEKNEDLTPEQITSRSNQKVWWLCSKGHAWETTVFHRAVGHGCPSCSATGFDPTETGYLYVIWNPLMEAWKIGISGHLAKRLKEHRQAGFNTENAAVYEHSDGDYIQSLEKELKTITKTNGAVSLKDAGGEQLSSNGYTETWLGSSFTPKGVKKGDCQAMLKWLMEELKRLDWENVVA